MEIARGAEAVIKKEKDVVIKERIAKGYRLKEIDERLRKRRTALEARLLREARRAGVNTPQILEEDKFSLKMEFVNGEKVRNILTKANCMEICNEIGEAVAKLHSYDIVHGDLTTSNMIIVKGDKMTEASGSGKVKNPHGFSLYLIDFGLGSMSQKAEDKAVDLYVLHEMLESTHFDLLDDAWQTVLNAYRKHYRDAEKVIKTLSEVEKRGRYKERG